MLCIKVELIKGLYTIVNAVWFTSFCSKVRVSSLSDEIVYFRYAGCTAQEVTNKLRYSVSALQQVRLCTCCTTLCQVEGIYRHKQGCIRSNSIPSQGFFSPASPLGVCEWGEQLF